MYLTQVPVGRPDIRVPEEVCTDPAVARLMLGDRLRRLREAQFVTAAEAGHALRTSPGAITSLESGHTRCAPRDVADLLTIYQITDEPRRRTVLDLAEAAAARGWWGAYADVLPGWLEARIALEQAAGTIRDHEVRRVPDLLQTGAYARAALALDHPHTQPEGLRRRAELRLRRQQVLYEADAPRLWAVIDESALRRPLGGAAAMRAQLRRLIVLSGHPRITLQVMPSTRASGGGSLSLFRLPQPRLPDVVCLEQPAGARFPDGPAETEHYRRRTDKLVTTAAPATETREILHRILNRT